LLEKVKKLRTLYFNQLDYFLESFFMAKKNKGFFMVLEGIDGSGTSTHTRKVSNWIRKLEVDEVVQTSEPTKGMIGRLIKERLKEGGEGRANNIEEAVIDALLFALHHDLHLHGFFGHRGAGSCAVHDGWIRERPAGENFGRHRSRGGDQAKQGLR